MYIVNDIIVFNTSDKLKFRIVEYVKFNCYLAEGIEQPEFFQAIATAENSKLVERKINRYAKIK